MLQPLARVSTGNRSNSNLQPAPQQQPGVLYTTLQKRLARLGFSDWSMLPLELVQAGELWPFAHVLRFVLHQSVHATSHFLQLYPWFVVEKDDGALVDAVLKLLRLEYSYTASLTPAQFKKTQFGDKKLTICTDFIALVGRTEQQLTASLTPDTKKKSIAERSTVSQMQLQQKENYSVSCDRLNRSGYCDNAIVEKRNEIAEELRLLDLKRRALNKVLRQPQSNSSHAHALTAKIDHS